MIPGPPRTRFLLAAVSVAVMVAVAGCSGGGPRPPVEATESPTASPSGRPAPGPSSTPSNPVPPPAVTQKKPGWALDRIDQRQRPLDKRFTTVGQGQGVTVYVVDGLFDVTNAEFGGRASVGWKRGRACVLEDGTNHGLFVAGLVAGRRTGVAKEAAIVLVGSSNGCEGGNGDETEEQSTARVVRALTWVADHARRPAVVNLSLNVDAPAPGVTAGVQRLIEAGLTVVASAGNDGADACGHPPAGLPTVVTVGASTKADEDAGLNHGRCVDLFAPAEGITSVADPQIVPDRLVTSEFAATSWAAPFVSGAAALYLAVHPEASPAEVRAWLIDNATTGALRGPLHGSPDRLLFVGGPV